MLDVVVIEKKDREALDTYLTRCLATKSPPAAFRVLKAECVKLRWHGSTVHVDSSLWSASEERLKKVDKPKESPPCTIDIRLQPQALEVLVPGA